MASDGSWAEPIQATVYATRGLLCRENGHHPRGRPGRADSCPLAPFLALRTCHDRLRPATIDCPARREDLKRCMSKPRCSLSSSFAGDGSGEGVGDEKDAKGVITGVGVGEVFGVTGGVERWEWCASKCSFMRSSVSSALPSGSPAARWTASRKSPEPRACRSRQCLAEPS